MNKLFSTLLVCLMCITASAKVTEWTGNAGSAWDNASNWTNGVPGSADDVIIPAGKTIYPVLTAATTVNNIYFDVRLMDGADVLTSARLGNQHYLTYNEVFYDLTIKANRYVRVASPLKATVTGDYYVKHQTLNQEAYADNKFVEATYEAEEKKAVAAGQPYVNRSVKGTYYSFYSDYYRICDPYNTYSVDETVDQWAAPVNGLNTSIEANGNSTSFDVWVSNGAVYGDDLQDQDVTFRFPSSNTVYDYYATDGNLSMRNPDNIRRTGKGKFVLAGTTYEETLTHPNGVNSSMFAAGNPAFAWLDMAELLYRNSKTMAPFIFLHNEVVGQRGSENIYYCDYNETGSKKDLYRIGTEVATAGEPAAGDVLNTYSARTKIAATSEEAYIRPAEGFRVMGGSVGFTCDEPDLIGVFTNSTTTNTKYSIASEVRAKYYNGTSKVNANWGSYKTVDVSMLKNANQEFAMAITTTGNPSVVRLNNFLNRGSVLATISKDPENEKKGTLTIKDGSAIAAVFQGPTSTSWTASSDGDYWFYEATSDKDVTESVSYSSFGTTSTSFNGRSTSTTITDRSKSKNNGTKSVTSRTLKVHGLSSSTPLQLASTAQSVSYKILSTTPSFNAFNITNSTTQDVVLNYEISNDGKVSISLPEGEKIFIESDAAVGGALPAFNVVLTNSNEKINDYLCEAWFAYESIVAEKQNVSAPAGQTHIFEAGLGTYDTFVRENIGKVTLNGNEMIDYGRFSEHETPYSIQIKPVLGSYNTVGILGLYPEDNTTMVLGQITKNSDGTYDMTIPAGQVAHYAGTTADPTHDYYFYSHGSSSDMIKPVVLRWGTFRKGNRNTYKQYTGWHQTTAADNNACHESMISRQMIQPKTSSPWFDGLVYGEQSNNSSSGLEGNIFYLDQINNNYEDDAEDDATISNPDAGVAHQIKLNYTNQLFWANLPVAAPAPARAAADRSDAPMFITAVSGEVVANTMIVRKDNAKNKYSRKEDAPLFNANERAFAFGSLAGTHLVAINAINTLDTLPLFLSNSATLQFTNSASLADQVYLYDAVAETTTAIVDGTDYTLEIVDGEQAGRYFLIGVYEAPSIETDIEDVQTEGFAWKPVAYCPASGSLSVACAEAVRFEIFNINGQMVGSSDRNTTFNGMSAGVYVVSATRGAEKQSLKVIVY